MRIDNSFAAKESLFNTKFAANGNNEKKDGKSDSLNFGQVLKNCIDDTNSKLVQSNSATTSFIKGDDVNIDEVMVKNQEASLSLQFLAQTRDKLLDGYNQLSKLQL